MGLSELEALVRAARNQIYHTIKRGRPKGSLNKKPRILNVLPKIREKRPQQDGSRSQRALELLLENQTRTYTDIAQEIGATRELVRQIANKRLGETGKTRMRIRHEIRDAARIYTAADIPWFRIKIHDWLEEAGYGYCGQEKHEGPRVVDYRIRRGAGARCKACNARHQRGWQAVPENKAKVEAYYKSPQGREVQRRASKKWDETHPGKRSEIARKAYLKAISTPEGREKTRQYQRDYYARRKALQVAGCESANPTSS